VKKETKGKIQEDEGIKKTKGNRKKGWCGVKKY
jgi:hypothetical protein